MKMNSRRVNTILLLPLIIFILSVWTPEVESFDDYPFENELPNSSLSYGYTSGWQNQQSVQESTQPGFGSSGIVGSGAVNTDLSAHERSTGRNAASHQPQGDGRLPEQSGASQTPYGAFVRPARGPEPVCSNGLRLAFDCALKRVTAFGVRDHLVEKYELPMVSLDVCLGDNLIDVEQCIPDDFIDTFPSDTLLKVVRQKRLTVGTMDLSVFPQLASDQGYTTGFYPELLQSIIRELTVIVLQNPGLRRELVGDRPLNISILEQPFSKRLQDMKAAVAQKWHYGNSCGSRSSMAVPGLQQLPVSSAGAASSFDDSLSGDGGQSTSWQDVLLCADAPPGPFACELHGCLSPWEQIPKDMLIGITHVKFSTPMNLIAAVHRGEVDMTDIGTLASAYLPERYNFLPLRDVLEPSCTIGAWKSFFLLHDPTSKRRRDHRGGPVAFKIPKQTTGRDNEPNVGHSGFPLGVSGRDAGGISAESHRRSQRAKDLARDGWLPVGTSEALFWDSLEVTESWEDQVNRTRKLFFKLYGVQSEGSSTGNGQDSAPTFTASGASSFNASRNADTETAYEEKTLVKLHHVDHFTFSYLFPEEFRICSVRKLKDLSSLLSDREPLGAFGYGLAGRGWRGRIPSGSTWPPQQMLGKRVLSPGLRREAIAALMNPSSRHRAACDLQSVSRRNLRQDDGLPQVIEFTGPLVPLAAFFAKSRDGACRGSLKRTLATAAEKPAAASPAAVPKTLSYGAVLGILFMNFVFAW